MSTAKKHLNMGASGRASLHRCLRRVGCCERGPVKSRHVQAQRLRRRVAHGPHFQILPVDDRRDEGWCEESLREVVGHLPLTTMLQAGPGCPLIQVVTGQIKCSKMFRGLFTSNILTLPYIIKLPVQGTHGETFSCDMISFNLVEFIGNQQWKHIL